MSPALFTLNQRLVLDRESDPVSLIVPQHAVKVEAKKDILSILDFFKTPRSAPEFHAAFPHSANVFALLQDSFVVLAESEKDFLSEGFLWPDKLPIGQPCIWADLPRMCRTGAFGLFGAPYDLGATEATSAREGPRVIRSSLRSILPTSKNYQDDNRNHRRLIDTNLRRSIDLSQILILDLGNLSRGESNSTADFEKRVDKVVSTLHRKQAIPVMLGGDHSITLFALRPFLKSCKALGIIHFDAHSDLYGPFSGPYCVLNHANPFVFALQHSSLAVLHQIGVRAFELLEGNSESMSDRRVTTTSAVEIHRQTPAKLLGHLPTDIPYYLTFDIDCIDPSFAPETGSPVVGGLSFSEALELFDYATRRFQIVGADFVEVGDRGIVLNQAAAITASLIITLVYNQVCLSGSSGGGGGLRAP